MGKGWEFLERNYRDRKMRLIRKANEVNYRWNCLLLAYSPTFVTEQDGRGNS